MKNKKLLLQLVFLITSSLIVSCNENCRDGLFELQDVSIEPRRWFPGENIDETEDWDNELEFPIVVLKVQINMDKFYRTLPEFEGNCFPKYVSENPIKDIKVFSNQSFGDRGPLQDISDICLFSPRGSTQIGNFLSKREWLDFYVNESNFSKSYFVFNVNPDVQALHKIRMVFEFEDGSSIETNEIEVLITPATPRA